MYLAASVAYWLVESWLARLISTYYIDCSMTFILMLEFQEDDHIQSKDLNVFKEDEPLHSLNEGDFFFLNEKQKH